MSCQQDSNPNPMQQMSRYYSASNDSCMQGGGCRADDYSALHNMNQMGRYYSASNASCMQGGGCRADDYSALHNMNQMGRYYSASNASCMQGGGCRADDYSALHNMNQMGRSYSATNSSCPAGSGCPSDEWSALHQVNSFSAARDLRLYQDAAATKTAQVVSPAASGPSTMPVSMQKAAVPQVPPMAPHVAAMHHQMQHSQQGHQHQGHQHQGHQHQGHQHQGHHVPRPYPGPIPPSQPGFGPWPVEGIPAPMYSRPTQKPVIILDPRPGAQMSLTLVNVSSS